jgi:FAD/FMN-containing dehydrogenase
MKSIDRPISKLRGSLGGRLVEPADSLYERARRVFNGDIDRYPRAIAYCESTSDIRSCLEAAGSADLRVGIRGSGHNIAGRPVVTGGLVIDMSAMKGVRVNPTAGQLSAKAGTTWAELDRAAESVGAAVPGGTVSSTGIVGLTMGGGIGWLLPSLGLACDKLVGAKLLTTSGELIAASDENTPDIMWALRGGGYGLGVVVEFTYGISAVGQILGGSVTYQGPDVAGRLVDLLGVLPALDDSCMLSPCLQILLFA